MNTPDKSQIKPLQEKILGAIRAVEKAREAIATIEADITKFTTERNALNSPDYTDTKAIARVNTLNQQIEFANDALSRATSDREEAIAQLKGLAIEGGDKARSLLSDILERRLETIAAVILPFTKSEASAVLLAEQTDCYRAATEAVHSLNGHRAFVSPDIHPGRVVKFMRRVLAILSEALKDNPDLMQFIPDHRSAN